ncbi:MAG TPA: TetR/AcrR family transcriptional regulator [Frankiaceae bacterium]|nr:TetR/AcrR family transcriptional regulator [Frankiaceae bacterium]
MTVSPARARQRRRPEEAEREILDAAEALLREGAVRTPAVAEVMARTGLGRSSFYVYFRDVPDLLYRLSERVEGELFAVARAWLAGDGDPVADARRSLAGVVAVYLRHGPLLCAIKAAAGGDPQVERRLRAGPVEHFVGAVAGRIEDEAARGRIPRPVPRDVARALVLMNEAYLLDTLGRVPPEDPGQVVAALHFVWTRALYGHDPGG